MPDYIAIGDIHGMSTLLDAVLEQLPAAGTLVFLGDYLDRGPDARGVINRLLRLRETRPCIFLRGNHEEMAMHALENYDSRPHWLANGGVATVESYGGRLTPEHLAFIEATLPYFATDDYIFVHAGIPPGQQPEDADPQDLRWIRAPFLNSHYAWGRLVIHGHTPTRTGEPDIQANRINIDTGAVYGGKLTALLLPERTFIAAPS